jgi:hypothetical protein
MLKAHHRRGDRDAALALDPPSIRAHPPPLALLPVVVRREVNSYTAGLDDPQRAFRRPRTEHGEELSYAIEEGGMCGPRPDLEHHYAGAAGGRISKHLPNPRALNRRSVASDARGAIHCDQRSAFGRAHFKQCLVRRASQPLADNCNGVVAGGANEIGRAPAEILVELEFHAGFSAGTGMTRSRAASAPYAIAASTSSWVSPGYWSSSSASVMSSARKSRISETQIRVPFMHGCRRKFSGLWKFAPEEGSRCCLVCVRRRFSRNSTGQSSTAPPTRGKSRRSPAAPPRSGEKSPLL